MNFINDLKIAIVNANIQKLDELSNVEFKSENKDELLEASALILEAIKVLEAEKTKTSNAMNTLRKMQKYAQSLQYKDSL